MKEKLHIGLVALRNILVGGNVAALRFVGRPAKLVQYSSESLFLLKAMRRARGLPERPIDSLDSKPQPQHTVTISNEALGMGDGMGSYLIDVINLATACRLTAAQVYFEIGTLQGLTAYQAALNTADTAKVYTLDLPMQDAPEPTLKVTAMDQHGINSRQGPKRMLWQGTPVENKVTQLLGDSASFDYTPYHGQVDVFFVDGSHSYEYVRSDTLHALECCHEGSLLLWHDFGRVGVNGVSRWLFEMQAAGFEIYVVPGGSLAHMKVPADWRQRIARL